MKKEELDCQPQHRVPQVPHGLESFLLCVLGTWEQYGACNRAQPYVSRHLVPVRKLLDQSLLGLEFVFLMLAGLLVAS